MRRILRALGVTTATVLCLGAPPAAVAAPGHKVTITVVGLSRTGAQVAVQSQVVPLRGNAMSPGPTYTIVPGTYYIGASVPTLASGAVVSDTIVIRRLTITASGTIRLDSRGGKRMSIWLNGRNLGLPLDAQGCIRGGFGIIRPDSLDVPLYVRPVRAAGVGFDWASRLPGPGGSSYDLAGESSGGLPARPVYRLSTSGLIRTVVQGRSGTLPDTSALWSTSLTEPDGCVVQGQAGRPALPFQAVDYRTPGNWTTEVDTSHGTHMCSMTWVNQRYQAGHQYLASFEDAARGPSQAVPVIIGTALSFNPTYQFASPQTQGYAYCLDTTVILSQAGRTLRKQHFTDNVHIFTATVHSGWYVLAVNSRQEVPGERMPVGLLSPRTSLTWRFRASQGAVPVAELALLPRGLDVSNDAAPRSITRFRAWPTQSRYTFPPGPASAPRSVRVQFSYDDGSTWHTAVVVRHGGSWLFQVRNPASGYVTLRSTAVNALGDSSVQTIYRAYGIR